MPRHATKLAKGKEGGRRRGGAPPRRFDAALCQLGGTRRAGQASPVQRSLRLDAPKRRATALTYSHRACLTRAGVWI